MKSLELVFNEAKKEGRIAVIGYLPAGYPDRDGFLENAQAAFESGLDILEIGLPSRHPSLDGEIIQAAVAEVIRQGMTRAEAFDLAAACLKSTTGAGLAMFYANSLEETGEDQFLLDCRNSQLSGILPVGMDFQPWSGLAKKAKANRLEPVGFLGADLDQARMQEVISLSGGFLYLQSQSGVTGGSACFDEEFLRRLQDIKEINKEKKLPLAVGFGIKNGQDVRALVETGVDGVIVGTAMVEAAGWGVTCLKDLVAELRQAASFAGKE